MRSSPRLITLGRLDVEGLERSDADRLLRQRKPVALLVYLASIGHGTFAQRDQILPLLWPELDQTRARHALRNALHGLRGILGKDSVVNRGQEEIALRPDALVLDARLFHEAYEGGHHADAVALYQGEFLSGFHVRSVSPAWERWLDLERDRHGRVFRSALEQVALALASEGRIAESTQARRRLSALNPLDSAVLMRLMTDLSSMGDVSSALRAAEANRRFLLEEYETQQDPRVAELAKALQAESTEGGRVAIGDGLLPTRAVPEAHPTVGAHSIPAAAGPRRETGRQRMYGVALLGIAGLAVSAGAMVDRSAGGEQGLEPAATVSAEASDLGGSRPSDPVAIAVLPFSNPAGSAEQQSFVDGFHDEVLTQLGKIGSLAVKGRASALEYLDSPKSIRAIGTELDAQYIVEGGVTRSGERVRISVRLLDVRTEEQLWSESYDRSLTVSHLLDVQREIALSVTTQLGAEILPGERLLLDVRAPENLTAYEQYLDGLARLREVKRSGDFTMAARGVEAFERSIVSEPEWAPPWAGLGQLLAFMASGGQMEPDVNYPRSLAASEEALRIDSLYAPAWSTLAFVKSAWYLDFRGAEEARMRAAGLGAPWDWQEALLFLVSGRYEEAIAAYARGLTTEPHSGGPKYQGGWALACAGRFDEAQAWWDRHVDDPERLERRLYTAYVHIHRGNSDVALAMTKTLGLSYPGFSALIYALADSTERASALLAQAERQAPGGVREQGTPAAAAVVLGQPERALDYLEYWAEAEPRHLPYAFCYEEVRSLAGHPRYQAVRDKIGFPRPR